MRLLKFLAIPAVLLVAAIAFAATKFPSVVLSRAALASYTSTVAASLSTAEVIELGHFGFYQYSASSNATADGNSVIIPSDSPASGRWLLQAGTLNGSVSFTVCASGCNFASLQSAIAALNAYTITPGAIINLNLSCHATLTSTTPVTIFPPVGGSLYISGCAHTNHTVTGIVSSSGSSGAWSITAQMGESVSNITAGNDYVIVTGAANGTNPTRLVGVWPVTAVNTGSNQITFTTTNRAAAAPSGSVTATVADISSVLAFNGVSGIEVWNGASVVNLQDVVLAGNGTANTLGLDVEDNGRAYIGSDFGVYGFGGAGLYANLSAEINNSSGTTPVVASNDGIGIHASGGTMNVSPCVASGNSTYGVEVDSVGYIGCTNPSVSGNGSDGLNAQSFAVISAAGGGYSNDNGGWGVNASNDVSEIYSGGLTENGNTSGSVNAITAVNSLSVGGTLLCAASRQCTGFSTVQTSGSIYVGSDNNALLERNGNDLALQTFGGYGVDLLGHGVIIGAPTGGSEGLGTLNIAGALYANGTIGATCSGTPTSSFATVGGIVTHC